MLRSSSGDPTTRGRAPEPAKLAGAELLPLGHEPRGGCFHALEIMGLTTHGPNAVTSTGAFNPSAGGCQGL
jgi:hypothetical protein